MIETITYKDQAENVHDIPIRISYYAMKHFQLDTGKTIEAVEQEMNLMEVLFWFSMEAGYKKMNLPNPFKREDCETILDDCLEEFTATFGLFFSAQTEEAVSRVKEKLKK